MRTFQVGLAWLGTALLAGAALFGGCARPGSPSGGPRDVVPPMIASTWPDTFAVIEPTRDPVKIVFSERISERPTQGSLDDAVLVSPVTGEHRVKHTRSGLEIDIIGGFQPDLVYRVRLLPTIKDLFGNTIEGPFELVFSTGPEFENNVVAGVVEDRITGEAVNGIRVEARDRGLEDPPVHVAATDSAGVFALRYLPSGSYDLSLYQDINRNTEPDFSELQGMAEGTLGLEPGVVDTLIIREVPLLRPDTTPARLIRVEAIDSLVLRLAFDDYLDAEGTLGPVTVQISQEELGPGPAIDRVLWPRQLDSLRAVEDSIAAEERRVAMVDSLRIVADSLNEVLQGLQAAQDTLGADSVGSELARIEDAIAPPDQPEEPVEEETPAEPPPILPQQELFVRMADSLVANLLYQITVSGVVNLNELGGGGGETTFTWEPPEREEEEPDTSAVPPDTAAVPPDTAAVPPDTTAVPPDTAAVPPDTMLTPPDTSGVPPDTSGVPSRPEWLTPHRPLIRRLP